MKKLILQFGGKPGSKLRFAWRACATAALLMTGLTFAVRGLLHADTPVDFSGTYMADDGGIYYAQQSGNILWWAGLSLDSDLAPDLQWHRGLNFSNVFKGTINSDNTISGEWTDVTRGGSLNHGSLTVKVSTSGGMVQFTKLSYTGSFGANSWTQTAPLDDTQFDGVLSTIYSKFDVVHKNGGETLEHDLKPYRDSTVFYGQLMTSAMDLEFNDEIGYYGVATHEPPLVNYPNWGTASRSYTAFAGENGDDDGSKDGDFDLRVKIDLDKLEPDFSVYGWENHDQAPDIILSKLNSELLHNVLGLGSHFAYMHPEAIEYGVASGLSLLPGWADLSSNSILVNGRPINGQVSGPNTSEPPDAPCGFVQPCPYKDYGDLTGGIRIGNLQLSAGTYIRVTGALVLDCGHGATTPCYDDPSDPDEVSRNQNQEIHPVYSIDVLNSPFTPEDIGVSARANLTGTWGGNDGSTYYVRQIGNTVWLFGLFRDRQPNQQGTSYDLIGSRHVAAAGLLVGSPLCSSTMRCWMFATVVKGTLSSNSDGSSIIQGDWAGAPQSTSPGSTGGSVTFSVDKYHKVITPQTMQGIFPDTLQKMYEPVTDILPPQITLTIGTPQVPSGGQNFVGTATQFQLTGFDGDSGVQNFWYRFYPAGSANPPVYTAVVGSSASFTMSGADGLYQIDYYATDNAGNDEPAHSQVVNLDGTAPQSTLTIGSPEYSSSGGQVYVTGATPFTVSATDSTSGVQAVSYRIFLSGTTPPPYSRVTGASVSFHLGSSDGLYEVDSYATDNVGNNETAHTQMVRIDTTPPQSGGTCNGVYGGTFNGNVNVSNGQVCTFFNGGVTGNVTVTQGGTFGLNNASAGGNIQLQGGGNLILNGAMVSGNVQINGGGTFKIGPGTTINKNLEIQNIPSGAAHNQICSSNVKGNLQFHNNGTAVDIGAPGCAGNTVGGNLQVQNNNATVNIFGNTIGINLQCVGNAPAPAGNGNSAKAKQGQCSGF